jgi:hypothetical protein
MNWISVEDRLPEFFGEQIVCLESRAVMMMVFSTITEEPFWFIPCIGQESKNNKVTHWMPMPEAPK